MDFATVKAKVKAWERGFRTKHGRDPTRQDMKADKGDILEMYALYRQLWKSQSSKPVPSAPSAPPAPPSSTASSSRTARRAAGPTTPSRNASRSGLRGEEPSEAGPSRHPISSQKQTFSTPKKDKKREGYTGPVADPLGNPFSTPQKKGGSFESPFIHANSPRRLREVLEANSLHRSRTEITPRTRARKRLAGEEVDATPAKIPRRQRRDRPPPPPVSESEEEFEQTPIKPGSAIFALMDDLRPNGKAKEKGKANGKGTKDLFPIFQRVKRAPEEDKVSGRAKRRNVMVEESDDDGPGSPTPVPPITIPADPPSGPSFVPETAFPAEDDRLPIPPPGDIAPPATRTPRARDRIIKLSDDEWDPEADTRTVRVVGTRRRAVRVAPLAGVASDDEMEYEETEDVSVEVEVDDSDEDGDANATTIPMLSYLSLRSPVARAGERLADLRVRALLDPTSAAAAALRAASRGQDVFVCGEVDGEGDEWDMQIEREVEGDDDWESDAEGWKAVPADEPW